MFKCRRLFTFTLEIVTCISSLPTSQSWLFLIVTTILLTMIKHHLWLTKELYYLTSVFQISLHQDHKFSLQKNKTKPQTWEIKKSFFSQFLKALRTDLKQQ